MTTEIAVKLLDDSWLQASTNEHRKRYAQTEWKNIQLPPHLKKAREEQERFNQEKKDGDVAEKDLKFTTAEEYMKQDIED